MELIDQNLIGHNFLKCSYLWANSFTQCHSWTFGPMSLAKLSFTQLSEKTDTLTYKTDKNIKEICKLTILAPPIKQEKEQKL